MIHLLPIGTPKAVTWCGVLERKDTYPYVGKCERDVVGKLMEQDIQLLKELGDWDIKDHGCVCQLHADRIDAYLEEVSGPARRELDEIPPEVRNRKFEA